MKNLQNKRNYSKNSSSLAQRRRASNAVGLQPPEENEETATSIAEASKEDAAFALRRTFLHANTLKCDDIIRTLPEYKSFQTVIIHISIIIWATH